MTPTPELVARLRNYPAGMSWSDCVELFNEAADEIARLQAEVARLKEEANAAASAQRAVHEAGLRKIMGDYEAILASANAAREAAEARVVALEAGLKRLNELEGAGGLMKSIIRALLPAPKGDTDV